jgi:hypothetical protein
LDEKGSFAIAAEPIVIKEFAAHKNVFPAGIRTHIRLNEVGQDVRLDFDRPSPYYSM